MECIAGTYLDYDQSSHRSNPGAQTWPSDGLCATRSNPNRRTSECWGAPQRRIADTGATATADGNSFRRSLRSDLLPTTSHLGTCQHTGASESRSGRPIKLIEAAAEDAGNVGDISVFLQKEQGRGAAIGFRDDPYTLADGFISGENARAMHHRSRFAFASSGGTMPQSPRT